MRVTPSAKSPVTTKIASVAPKRQYENKSHANQNRVQIRLSHLRPAHPGGDQVEWSSHQLFFLRDPHHHSITAKSRKEKSTGPASQTANRA